MQRLKIARTMVESTEQMALSVFGSMLAPCDIARHEMGKSIAWVSLQYSHDAAGHPEAGL